MMVKKIYKYQLGAWPGNQNVNMPKGAKIVHFGLQENPYESLLTMTIWAEVHVSASGESLHSPSNEARYFYVYGTGHVISDDMEYVGTTVDHQRAEVWHLYERR